MASLPTPPTPPTPPTLHRRIKAEIEQRILSGAWPPGHRIPSELELCAHFDCARMTVNKVLTELVQVGMIERRRRAGSFVSRPQHRAAVLDINDIRAEVAALGLVYRHEILAQGRRRATAADRERFGDGLQRLPAQASVLAVAVLHRAGERPFCLEDRLIDLQTVPSAVEATFADESPGAWLRQRVPWTSAEHRIRAQGASVQEAHQLALAVGTACLVVERRTWLARRAVTQVRFTYPGADHELIAHFSPETVARIDGGV